MESRSRRRLLRLTFGVEKSIAPLFHFSSFPRIFPFTHLASPPSFFSRTHYQSVCSLFHFFSVLFQLALPFLYFHLAFSDLLSPIIHLVLFFPSPISSPALRSSLPLPSLALPLAFALVVRHPVSIPSDQIRILALALPDPNCLNACLRRSATRHAGGIASTVNSAPVDQRLFRWRSRSVA
jgi:hypothetical protein